LLIQVLASPLLSSHGTVLRISAYRRSMHEVIPKIHQRIEMVRRVRSFTAQSGDSGGGNGGGSGKGARKGAAGGRRPGGGTNSDAGSSDELVTLDYFLGERVAQADGRKADSGSSASELEALQASLSSLAGVVRVLSDVVPAHEQSPTLLATSPAFPGSSSHGLPSAGVAATSSSSDWPSFLLPPTTASNHSSFSTAEDSRTSTDLAAAPAARQASTSPTASSRGAPTRLAVALATPSL